MLNNEVEYSTDGSDGVIVVYFDRENNTKEGKVYAEVKIIVENVKFKSNQQHIIVSDIELGDFENSVI